jgi:hypothetical protein
VLISRQIANALVEDQISTRCRQVSWNLPDALNATDGMALRRFSGLIPVEPFPWRKRSWMNASGAGNNGHIVLFLREDIGICSPSPEDYCVFGNTVTRSSKVYISMT